MNDEPAAPSARNMRLPVSRRAFIGGGIAVAAVVGGGGATFALQSRPVAVATSGAAVRAVERARSSTGAVVRRELVARPADIDLGGRVVTRSMVP